MKSATAVRIFGLVCFSGRLEKAIVRRRTRRVHRLVCKPEMRLRLRAGMMNGENWRNEHFFLEVFEIVLVVDIISFSPFFSFGVDWNRSSPLMTSP